MVFQLNKSQLECKLNSVKLSLPRVPAEFPPSVRSCTRTVWRTLSQSLRLATGTVFKNKERPWNVCLVEPAKPFVLVEQSGLTCSVH